MRDGTFCNRAHEKISRVLKKIFACGVKSKCHARASNPYFSDIILMSVFATHERARLKKFLRAHARDHRRACRRVRARVRAYTLR
jgi:hypothetical protein